MSDGNSEVAAARHARRWVWIAGVAAAVVVAVIVAIVVSALNAPKTDVTAVASPTATTTAGQPSVSPAPQPSPTGSHGPASSGPAPLPTPRLPAVAPDKAVSTSGITVRIVKIEHVKGQASGAGEIAGPALRLTIRITNNGADALSLSSVVVNAYYGADLIPANTFERPGGAPFNGSLAPGRSASGVYLFAVSKAQQGNVTVTVDYRAGRPMVVFHGSFQ